METYQVPSEEAAGKCSWCGKATPADPAVFGFGGKARPGVDLLEFEGGALRITLATQDKSVIAIVPGADSDARRDGYDFMFMVCSEECGQDMKAALDEEISLGNTLFQNIENMNN